MKKENNIESVKRIKKEFLKLGVEIKVSNEKGLGEFENSKVINLNKK